MATSLLCIGLDVDARVSCPGKDKDESHSFLEVYCSLVCSRPVVLASTFLCGDAMHSFSCSQVLL